LNYLITIVGPTGIGKTKLSIALAKHFQCDILSCDSRQFYKEMKIGTAVPSDDELSEVQHHFIHNVSIHDTYNVGKFEKDIIEKLNELFVKNSIQIMVGGSGLYVDAVMEGFDEFPDVPLEIREGLVKKLKEQGLEKLQEELKSLDIDTFNTIEIQNPHRIIRALEICIGTGEKYSSFKNKKRVQRNFTPILLGLDADRKVIYQRINDRVDQMMQDGLLDEVRSLFDYRDLNALQTVGYKELFEYFEGKYELDFAILEIKKNSRRYAKRQNTWFKRKENVYWFDYQTPIEGIIGFINRKKDV